MTGIPKKLMKLSLPQRFAIVAATFVVLGAVTGTIYSFVTDGGAWTGLA